MFSDLMFSIGGELGWDENMRHDEEGQNSFFLMASSKMELFDLESKLSFNEVLDNIALYYVIRREFKDIQNDHELEDKEEKEKKAEKPVSKKQDKKGDDKKDRKDKGDSSDDDQGPAAGGAGMMITEVVGLKVESQ